jgi:Tol biopolymer transport system component
MRRKSFLIIIVLTIFTITVSLLAQRLKVISVHNLFTDDIGKRERIFYEVFKAGGGFFSNPAWSPDGTKIAFDFCIGGQVEDKNKICIVNADGTGLKIISDQDDEDPCWSPDSSQIVFTSRRTGEAQIFKMNADGTNQVQLTYTGGYRPAWSPDGKKIAYNNTGIWIMNSDGTNVYQLTSHRSDRAPAWSPDGSKIAFDSDRSGTTNIWVINLDGTGLTQLTQKGGVMPTWSPDSKWIAFNREGQIWVVSSDGKEETHLRTKATTVDPTWSPDGKKILFSGYYDIKYDADLYVMTLK